MLDKPLLPLTPRLHEPERAWVLGVLGYVEEETFGLVDAGLPARFEGFEEGGDVLLGDLDGNVEEEGRFGLSGHG
jgi:hypothetical protein